MVSNIEKDKIFEKNLLVFFMRMLLFNLKFIQFIPFLMNNFRNQYKASNKRTKMLKEGITVPPVLALSITNKCNLHCKGCYLQAQKRVKSPELTDSEIIRLLGEAREIGTSMVLLLGGEPLLRDVFSLTSGFKNMIFSLFTNSTLIDDEILRKFKENKHIIPMLSMEGTETDIRRGYGILDNIIAVSKKMKKRKIMYGLSFTVTRSNIDEICNEDFIRKMIKNGSLFFSFFKYIPIDRSTIDMTLTPEQERKFKEFTVPFAKNFKSLVLSPANELKLGGCMGAGKGVVHINYDGAVEPCPFAPFSDISVKKMSFKQALQSKLFANLRKHQKEMIDNDMQMCTLWKDDKWDAAVKTNDFSFLENKLKNGN